MTDTTDSKDGLTYWYYDDVLSSQDCDALVQLFSQFESIDGDIDQGQIVEKLLQNCAFV